VHPHNLDLPQRSFLQGKHTDGKDIYFVHTEVSDADVAALLTTIVLEVPFVADGDLILSAENNGYFPATLYAKAGVPLLLNVVTENTTSCSRAFVIPALGVETILPRTGTVPIEIPPQEAGSVLRFTCSMGMYTGQIVFSQ
jgi:hypothetical protein